jgi:hypothetical protein
MGSVSVSRGHFCPPIRKNRLIYKWSIVTTNQLNKHNKETYWIQFKIHLKNRLSRLIVG